MIAPAANHEGIEDREDVIMDYQADREDRADRKRAFAGLMDRAKALKVSKAKLAELSGYAASTIYNYSMATSPQAPGWELIDTLSRTIDELEDVATTPDQKPAETVTAPVVEEFEFSSWADDEAADVQAEAPDPFPCDGCGRILNPKVDVYGIQTCKDRLGRDGIRFICSECDLPGKSDSKAFGSPEDDFSPFLRWLARQPRELTKLRAAVQAFVEAEDWIMEIGDEIVTSGEIGGYADAFRRLKKAVLEARRAA